MSERDFDHEEMFHRQERRESKKRRKRLADKDRSKYKKSDESKEAPAEPPKDAKRGRVLAIRPEGIEVLHEDRRFICTLKGALKKERSRQKNLVAVGDFVYFEISSEGEGAISFVEKRTSQLSRADSRTHRIQQLIAVNIDQVFIVGSVVAPPLKPFLIDRYLIAAKRGNMTPIIVINKMDLLTQEHEDERALLEEFRKSYRHLNIPIYEVSCTKDLGMERLREVMKGRTSVFSGQSGVGKSSLINATLGLDLTTGEIVEKTRKGSHTTSLAELIPLEENSFCIDTPGIKSFGIFELKREEIASYFPEILEAAHGCKFPNCTHIHEPECAVLKAIEEGAIPKMRYESYLTLMNNPIPKEWE